MSKLRTHDVEKYYVQIRWFNKKPYKGGYGSDTYKGKPVFGWTVSLGIFETAGEIKKFIKKELRKGNTLFTPPWYEKWNMIDGSLDIMSYEKNTIRNFKEWLK